MVARFSVVLIHSNWLFNHAVATFTLIWYFYAAFIFKKKLVSSRILKEILLLFYFEASCFSGVFSSVLSYLRRERRFCMCEQVVF